MSNFFAEHKVAIGIVAAMGVGVYALKHRTPPAPRQNPNQNIVSAGYAQQTPTVNGSTTGTNIIGSSDGLAASVAGALGSSGGSSTPIDTGAYFGAIVQQAKEAANVAKTSALSGVSVDTLQTMLTNVGNGQSVNVAYNDLGQVTGFSKSEPVVQVPTVQPVTSAPVPTFVDTWTQKADQFISNSVSSNPIQADNSQLMTQFNALNGTEKNQVVNIWETELAKKYIAAENTGDVTAKNSLLDYYNTLSETEKSGIQKIYNNLKAA